MLVFWTWYSRPAVDLEDEELAYTAERRTLSVKAGEGMTDVRKGVGR